MSEFLQAHAPYWVFWALVAGLALYERRRHCDCLRCREKRGRKLQPSSGFLRGGFVPEKPGFGQYISPRG